MQRVSSQFSKVCLRSAPLLPQRRTSAPLSALPSRADTPKRAALYTLTMEPLKAPILACLFDMDGLLLDTETCYTVAQEIVAARFGQTFTWELKAKLMGRKALEAAEVFVTELGIQDRLSPEQFLKEREGILEELFLKAPLLPGAERLVRHLHRQRIPIAVATSSMAKHYDLKTKNHGDVFDLFDLVITGDMVKAGKPDPEIFLLAGRRLGAEVGRSFPVGQTLVFEDAIPGLQAAQRAEMPCIFVPDPRLDITSVDKRGADVVPSLEAFQPERYGLPPYEAESNASDN